MVTGCKPPHNVPALQRTHRPVRHLLISRAEAQTVDLLYTPLYSSLLCRSRVPATSVLPVTPPLLHFITRPRIPGQSSFRQGQPAGKAGQLESQAIHAAGNNVTINPAPVDDNLPHLSLSLITRPALVPGSSPQMTSTRESESRQPPRVRSSGDHNR